MKLKTIFEDGKIEKDYITDRKLGFEIISEYDDDGNLITINKFDNKNRIGIHISDIKNDRYNFHVMSFEDYNKLDFGNFKRLINELRFYAQ